MWGKRALIAWHGVDSSVAQISSPAAVGGAVVDAPGPSTTASLSSRTVRRTTSAMTIRATATSAAPMRLAVTSARELLERLAHPLELEDEVVDVVGEGVGIAAAHADLGGAGAQLVEAGLVQAELISGRGRQSLQSGGGGPVRGARPDGGGQGGRRRPPPPWP